MKRLIVLVAAILIVGGCENPNWQPYVKACYAAKGHIYQPDGHDGTGYCLTEDGRMLEVYP